MISSLPGQSLPPFVRVLDACVCIPLLVNKVQTDLEENKSLNKAIFFVFFAHKNNCCSLITLELNY